MQESINLEFKEGSSDKVYQAELTQEASGWVVNFAYGRRGSSLTTGCKTCEPVPYEKAKKAYDSLVKSKVSKGYKQEGTLNTNINTVTSPEDSGIRPQLLNELTENDAIRYINDDLYCAQEKYDGRRKLIKKENGETIGINKKGFIIPLTQESLSELDNIPADFIIDGEDLGNKIMLFDNLTPGYSSLPYAARVKSLELIFSQQSAESCLQIVPTAWSTLEKQAMFDRLKSENAEGIVFKRIDTPYSAGRPASGGNQFKCKFYETASCVVDEIHLTKMSISLKVYDNQGEFIGVGNATVYPNSPSVKSGDVVEVKYLYYYEGGSIYQPVLLSVRDDVDYNECLLSKLKRKKE